MFSFNIVKNLLCLRRIEIDLDRPTLISKEIIPTVQPSTSALNSPFFCSRESYLPDPPLIHGRLILAAFDHGLNDATDNSARLVRIALEVFHSVL